MRVSSIASLHRAADFVNGLREDVRWIFDKEGKAEHLRRQVYSLQVTPMATEKLYVGVLNVLEWPKLMNPMEERPPYVYDVMRTYLATSRDGVHFDTDFVYSGSELIPHGECRQKPYCMDCETWTQMSAPRMAARPGARLTGCGSSDAPLPELLPLEELCCPFDHGIVIPASTLLTEGGEL